MNRPVVIHALTQKGRGYAPAEEHPKLFHGVGKFDALTGEVPQKSGITFSEAFGQEMLALAEERKELCALTAAMPGGTGLLDFKKKYPNRMFDVGIAEEHAVSMAGGLAKQGMVPVVAIYSTFLQRAFDMIMQDVALLKLHVVFGVDRAGLVGEDGETHHGVFDIGFLRQVPGMMVLCPASTMELRQMLRWAVLSDNGPVAIRYPRGTDGQYTDCAWNARNGVFRHRAGEDAVIITYGAFVNNIMEVADILESSGIHATVLRLMSVAPVPIQELLQMMPNVNNVFICEEVCSNSGIGDEITTALAQMRPYTRVFKFDLGDGFVTHGSVGRLYAELGLDAQTLSTKIKEVLSGEN